MAIFLTAQKRFTDADIHEFAANLYDFLTKQRASGTSGSSGAGTGQGYTNTGYSTGNNVFANIRSAINSGDLGMAEQMLAAITQRNAEWNFLMGSVYYKRGWFDEARSYFSVAANMEPANPEYQQALSYVNVGGYPYARSGFGMPAARQTDMCDICTAMMCANMLCRCR